MSGGTMPYTKDTAQILQIYNAWLGEMHHHHFLLKLLFNCRYNLQLLVGTPVWSPPGVYTWTTIIQYFHKRRVLSHKRNQYGKLC